MENSLPLSLRRLLKTLHILLAALSIGGLSSLLVVQLKMHPTGDHLARLTAAKIQMWLLNYLVTIPFYLLVLTGLIFSLFGGWGFIRHPWVTVKWVGAVLLTAGTVIWLIPAVYGMAALADGMFAVSGAAQLDQSLHRQALAAGAAGSILLALLIYLSVYKPWGRRPRNPLIPHRAVVALALAAAVGAAALAVTGNRNLTKYRKMEIRHVELSQLADGDYSGSASDGYFTYQVQATIVSGTMESAKAVKNRDSLFARVAEGALARAVARQSPEVDSITGATTTSKVLLKALANALYKGPDPRHRP